MVGISYINMISNTVKHRLTVFFKSQVLLNASHEKLNTFIINNIIIMYLWAKKSNAVQLHNAWNIVANKHKL